MENLSGTPGARTSITDLSIIIGNTLKGIICVQGITERGEGAKETLVNNWTEYKRKFGGLISGELFPLYCKQALESGAKLRVSRVNHYTDIDDLTTIQGVKATNSKAVVSVPETLASATLNVTDPGLSGTPEVPEVLAVGSVVLTYAGEEDSISRILISNGSTIEELAQYKVNLGDNSQDVAAGLASDLAAKNAAGVHNYTCIGGLSDTLNITAPVGSGSAANSYVMTFESSGTDPSIAMVTQLHDGEDYIPETLVDVIVVTVSGTNISPVTIAEYAVVTGDTAEMVADGIYLDFLAKANSGAHPFTGHKNNATQLHIIAPAGTGSRPNGTGYNLVTQISGNAEIIVSDFSGGVDAINANETTFTAKEVGSGYNGTTVVVTNSISGIAGRVDIEVTLPDSDISFKVTNVKNAPTSNERTTLNAKLEGVTLASYTGNIISGTYTLAGGAETIANIVTADYIGSSVSGAGLHSFDGVTDSMRFMNFNNPDPDYDIALVAYCEARKDMRAVTRTLLGLSASGVADYRSGTGIYAHNAIDSLYGDLWFTDAGITNPDDPQERDMAVSAIGFYAGIRARQDNKMGEWFSAAGDFGGKIVGVNSVPINFISPGNKGTYDSLYESGINAIVNHPTFGICAWGNRTLLKDRTKLTSKMNIADMCVFIARTLKVIAEGQSFKPNDFPMFNELYRKALPFIRNVLVDQRAIQGDDSPQKGEGKWWHWFGDQFAKTPSDLTFNTAEEIDAGKYRVRFAFKPIASNEYIAIDIAPADSATILNIQVLKTL